VAVDSSQNANIGYSPGSGYYKFPVEGILSPVKRYVDNFDAGTNDFIMDGFNVLTPSGFTSGALNSLHPYPSPNKDNTNFNFTATLKYPIQLEAGGKMTFDEIALVEPGDPGAIFGDANFYDYVIVEGSNDGGATWKPFVNGYDCRAHSSWEKLYNSSIAGQNSTAVPTPDLFVNRTINLLTEGDFSIGETVLIRFRLFSDPYANGWGWIIDNLKIQDLNTAVNPLLVSSGEISFFPNPVSDRLHLQIQAANSISKFNLKVYNSAGTLVFSRSYPVGSNVFGTDLDVSKFVPGLYLFALEPEKGQAVTRKILIQR
jgi:hypothetical protein